ncbi:MAG TPA: hypothetical protein VEH81_14700 [Ktedonobacteraceae bacterium]|nr:hypothetical protein [Ktedonobacteraceae bacterium]
MVRIRLGQHTILSTLRNTWQFLIVAPYTWLFICFFQPNRFSTEYERQGLFKRFVLMLRLALPVFIFTLPFAVALQFLLSSCFLTCNSAGSSSLNLDILLSMVQATVFGIACGIVAGVVGDVGLGIILGVALGITGIVVGSTAIGSSRGIAIAAVLGLVGGTGMGQKWGIRGGIMGCLVGGLAWTLAWSLVHVTTTITLSGLVVAAMFLASYLIGYYRLVLYPVSGVSAFRAYRRSRKNPLRVYAYLHGSSLYWDECVFLPLPHLPHTLLIAVEQDVQLALKEIAFIFEERPQQRPAALRASMDIALRDMEMRESIRDIARASGRLGEILPQEAILVDPRWVTPFTRLSDASREAARYCGPLSRQIRRHALQEMLAQLERIYPNTAFADMKLNTLLGNVITNWRAAARYEQQKLEQGIEGAGQIDNPYNPGQVLKPHDPLFVGRRDIVRQLSESLSRGDHSPTFLLNGERRMGKSSTLKQLPNLLGATYIPIVYDLQARGISSGIDVFLGKLAEEIYKVLSMRGLLVGKLERTQLQEAMQRNDAATYFLLDEWLDDIEKVLERENHTVLLLFDEFEKLEEAGLAGYLNLNLLLDWFRSTVQNRSHVALLFSGVQTFSELDTNWAGYFVNAKTLKVSFLQPVEARHLILSPTPNFPGREIFGEEEVDEIIRVTGCHPFMLQAICSELIEHLNMENRMRVEMQDIVPATDQILDNWWDTYFRDLWERSDQQQRTCLYFLSQEQESDLTSIIQRSGLEEQTARRTLQTLLKRDLVLLDKNTYRIAAPIFSKWVERST